MKGEHSVTYKALESGVFTAPSFRSGSQGTSGQSTLQEIERLLHHFLMIPLATIGCQLVPLKPLG